MNGNIAMRRWIALLAVGLLCITNTGCFMSFWSPVPAERSVQLMLMSEQLRQANFSVYRVMFMDDPSILAPQRNTGVVGP
jgi:hypothetical protein